MSKKLIPWLLIIVGIVIQLYGSSLNFTYRIQSIYKSSTTPSPLLTVLGPIATFIVLLGTILVVIGCSQIAKSKNRSWTWGLSGIIWFLGPIVVSLLPTTSSAQSPQTTKQLWGKLAAFSLIPSVIIFVISAFFLIGLGMGGTGMQPDKLKLYSTITLVGIFSPQIIYFIASIYFFRKSKSINPTITTILRIFPSLALFAISLIPYFLIFLMMLATSSISTVSLIRPR